MKKIIYLSMLAFGTFATAQVKMGSNPATTATNASFQVEGIATTNQFVVLKNGNVGIGTTAPTSLLDLATGTRTGTHSTTAEGFNITANLPSINNNDLNTPTGARIFHTNGTQGLVFGFDGISAEGSNNNTTLNLKSQTGTFNLIAGSTSNDNTLQRSSGSVLANNDFVREKRFAGNFATYLDEDYTQILNATSGSYNIIRQFNINDANNINRSVMRLQNSQVTADGLAGVPLTGYSGEVFFNNALQNRRIVLWDGARNSDHGFYGFGINGGTLRYQVDSPSSRHAFFAAIDNVSSKEIMTMLGNGNVGIGTSAPGTLFDVNGVARAATFTFPNPAGDAAPVITARTVPVGQGYANEKTELILFHSNDGSNGSGEDQITLRAPALSFQTYANAAVLDLNNNAGYNERMRILPNGNVGVGTTAPTATLEVKKDAIGNNTILSKFSSDTKSTWYVPTLAAGGYNPIVSAGDSGYFFSNDNDTTVSTNGFVIAPWSTSASGIKIMENGNVGIGATAPISKLHISLASTINSGFILQGGDYNAGYGAFWIEGGGSGQNLYISAKNNAATPVTDLTAAVNNSNIILNKDGGNVGIGTATPTAKLAVNGGIHAAAWNTITFQGAHLQWNRSSGQGETWLINQKGFGTGNSGIRFGESTLADVVTEWARFQQNGNFGVNTTNPTSKLTVVGLPIYANNAAALAGGQIVGAFYHAGDGILRVVF
jgi:hypothetical protein